MTDTWLDRRGNQLAVVGETLAHTPKAVYDEVMEDLDKRPGKVIQTSMISGAIAYGATLLMRRSPVLAGIVAGGSLLAETIRVGPGTIDFLNKASDADTQEERKYLVRRGSQALGREGALFLEALPGAMVGTSAGLGTLARSATARDLSYVVAERVEFPLRTKLPEAFYWRGPGTKLQNSLLGESGTMDALQASRLLPSQKPFSVEHARVIDPMTGRMSRTMSGTPDLVGIGFKPRPGQITIGTQNPRNLNPAMPSAYDIHAVPKGSIGVVNAGENTTFYIGQGSPTGPRRFVGPTEIDMKAVVINNRSRKAFLHDYTMEWNPNSGWTRGSGGRAVALDYDQALSSLSRVDRLDPWKTMSSIARSEAPGTGGLVSTLSETQGVRGKLASTLTDSTSATSSMAARLKHGFYEYGPTAARSTVISANPLYYAMLEAARPSDTP